MPDRVIRDELLQSERWLDLPTDTHRLVYQALLLHVDDYANCEGGRRLYRWIRAFSQTKTDTDAIKIMSDLQDANMVLRYEAGGKEYWHLTRFRNSRWYWKRTCPQSPYPDDNNNEKKQRLAEKRDSHVTNTLVTCAQGLGLGLGNRSSGSSNSPTRQGQKRLAEYLYKKPMDP